VLEADPDGDRQTELVLKLYLNQNGTVNGTVARNSNLDGMRKDPMRQRKNEYD
jgi:hypothetical protein